MRPAASRSALRNNLIDMEKFKRNSLIVYYIFIWLLFIINSFTLIALISVIFNSNFKGSKVDWISAVVVLALFFLWTYLLRKHFIMLFNLIIKRYLSETLILLGSLIFVYYSYLPARCIKPYLLNCELNHHIFAKTLGIFLVVLGILIIVRKFTNKGSK